MEPIILKYLILEPTKSKNEFTENGSDGVFYQSTNAQARLNKPHSKYTAGNLGSWFVKTLPCGTGVKACPAWFHRQHQRRRYIHTSTHYVVVEEEDDDYFLFFFLYIIFKKNECIKH